MLRKCVLVLKGLTGIGAAIAILMLGGGAGVLIGYGLALVGSLMNIIVVRANNGKMPVRIDYNALGQLHCLLTPESRYKYLADIIPIEIGPIYGRISVGDAFIVGGVAMILYNVSSIALQIIGAVFPLLFTAS